ncbi:MAG TPA: hypothetical protein VJQ83_03490, partial [Tepidiformaceae bacterium]|nr:hypothetical protein [Tepidiformaceae bacterium]
VIAALVTYELRGSSSALSECAWIRANFIASESTISQLAPASQAMAQAQVQQGIAWTHQGCRASAATTNEQRLMALYQLMSQATGHPPGRSSLKPEQVLATPSGSSNDQ